MLPINGTVHCGDATIVVLVKPHHLLDVENNVHDESCSAKDEADDEEHKLDQRQPRRAPVDRLIFLTST